MEITVWEVLAAELYKADRKKPHIEFAIVEHDFGVIKTNRPAQHVFTFKNTGNDMLIVHEVMVGCCGGVTIAWTKESVAPGDSGTVSVAVTPAKISCGFLKSIMVKSNDPDCPTVALVIRGQFINDVNWEPNDHVIFGNVVGTVPVSRNVDVWFAQPTKVLKVVVLSDVFQATFKEVEKLKRYTLEISTVPPLAMGLHEGDIKLHTDNPNLEWISCGASVMVVPKISCYPQEVTFLRNRDGWIGSTLVVRHNNGGQFRIVKTEANIKGMRVKVRPVVDGTAYQLLLKNPSPGIISSADGEITVYTDDKEIPVIRVPVHLR